jgi:EAL domain-containing protein (putative c-di-GMP-specific phosphodiesterase class I)
MSSRSGGHWLRRPALAREERLPLGPRNDRPVPAGAAIASPETEPARFLREIIDGGTLTVVWQAIVDLGSHEVLGYEALCRGPKGTIFEAAEFMFSSSHELELAHELDAACHGAVFASAVAIRPGTKLFLNVLPVGIVRGLVTMERLEALVRCLGLQPGHVVLELSERTAVADLDELRLRLEPFRSAGFLVAMDDIGAGYWSARLVPQVAPDFLKVDRSLVQRIHESQDQRDAVAAIVELGGMHSAGVVCEGIETQDELDCVRSLGAAYGQGFFLSAPLSEPVGRYPQDELAGK